MARGRRRPGVGRGGAGRREAGRDRAAARPERLRVARPAWRRAPARRTSTTRSSCSRRFATSPRCSTRRARPRRPRPGVRIVRGPYGVPSITGTTDFDAWWGVGYAVAQDRLFQLELFRRATSGRLAEILGDSFLPDDLIARRDYYTDAELDQMLSRLPANLVRRAEAYRDGINAWVDETRRDPEQAAGRVHGARRAAAHLDGARHRPDRRLPRPHRAVRRRRGARQPPRAARGGRAGVRQAAAAASAGTDLHGARARPDCSRHSPAAPPSRSGAPTCARAGR